MAAATITTASPEGRLPDRFWGIDLGTTNYEDYTQAKVAAIADAISPGWYRIAAWVRDTGTAAVPDTNHSNLRDKRSFYLARYTASLSGGVPTSTTPAILFGACTGPPNKPATAEPGKAQTTEPNGTGKSPSDVADHVTWFMTRVAAGYFKGVEFYNEPGTDATANVTGETNWYATTKPSVSSENWDSFQHRYFYNAVKAQQPNAPVCVWVNGNVSSINGDGAITQGIVGLGTGSWPHSDSQVPYYDYVNVHAYTDLQGGNRTVQQQNNTLYNTTWKQGSLFSCIAAGLSRVRAILNANGGTAKRIIISEFQIESGPTGYTVAQYTNTHVAVAIVGAVNAIPNKVDGVLAMGLQSDAFNNCIVRTGSSPNYTYTLQPGFFVYKQLARFFRNYVQSLPATWTSRTETTPAGTYVNSVPSAQMYCGMNDAGSAVGALMHNADTTNSITVNLTLDVTPTSATITRWTPTTTLPSTTDPSTNFTANSISASSKTYAVTLAPNEAAILDIVIPFVPPAPPIAPPINSVLPVVSGTASTGYQLAATTGTWDTATSYAYQWQYDPGTGTFVNVPANGTAATYIVSPLLVGATVRCLVTASNAGGAGMAATSNTTAAMTQGPLDPGVRADESPLSQDGNWAATTIQNDASLKLLKLKSNGIHANDAGGAICQGYRTDVSSSDVGLVQTMTATGGAGYSFSLWCRIQNPHNVSTMAGYLFNFTQGTGWRMFKCTGGSTFAQLGSTVGTPVPTNGMVQKLTCVGTSITGWTSVDNGATFTPVITVTDSSVTGAGTIGIEMKDGTDALALNTFDQVAVAAAPVNQTAPVASGGTGAGSTLTVTDGIWANGTTAIAYQWKRGSSAIVGATGQTYMTVQADVGSAVKCTVTATNANGSTPQDSNGITVTAVAPSSLVRPAVTGTVTPAAVLTTDNGTWDFAPTSYSYQWQSDTAGNLVFANISSATSSTYTIQAGDVGCNIKCVVTATNAAGSTSADSNIVGPVSGTTGELIGRIPI